MSGETAPASSGRSENQLKLAIGRITQRKRVTALVVIALVAALVGGLLAWQQGPQPPVATGPGHAAPTVAPTVATPVTTDVPGSPPPAATRSTVARLEPSEEIGGTVPVDATFRLTSVDGTPTSELAARLVIDPPLAFDLVPDATPMTARIVPTAPLAAGAVYRFALTGASGQRLDSWAFQARQGVRVVGTIPGNQEVGVPVDTGIEITFDQDGITNAEDHVTISPKVDGRFERHGRVLVFVPKALATSTAYTVTVSAGVTVAGTDEASTEDITFRFETSAARAPAGRLILQDDLIETATADRSTIGLWEMPYSDDWKAPTTIAADVYRLPSMDAAIDAYRAVHAWGWTRNSRSGLVDTGGLSRVVHGRLPLRHTMESLWLNLPKSLAAGWYVIQLESGERPMQAVIQVTDVSAYLAVSDTQTIVWANDVKSDRPIANATVEAAGSSLGRTAANGLLEAATPTSLLDAGSSSCPACPPIVRVATKDGRIAFLPVVSRERQSEDYVWGHTSSSRFWTVFETDRWRFRPTDTINAWGVLRDRDTDKVPASVTLRLAPGDEWADDRGPAIAAIQVKPAPTGAFSGSLEVTSLPMGQYTLELVVDDEVVSARGLSIGQIVKPAYRLELTTGHRVYIAGDRIKVSARASFFDGTPVPGLPLRLGDYLDRDVTTDADGSVAVATVARVSDDNEGQMESRTVWASPRVAEEGEISGGTREFVIFPSSRTIDGTGAVRGGRVRVTGAVHLVDQERLNGELAGGASVWELDPNGKPVGGARVTVRFVELVPIRGQGHQEYDFLQKKAVTVYEYSIAERAAGTVTVRTRPDGSFSASIAAGSSGHDYEIRLSTPDADGHVARQRIVASAVARVDGDRRDASFGPTDAGVEYGTDYGMGDSIDLTFVEPDGKTGARSFLFFDAQRGIRTAVVQPSARYQSTFGHASAPGVTIFGVRFNGAGYDVAPSYAARFRQQDRQLRVELTAPGGRRAPGDEVTVGVTVRDAAGTPVAASVVVRAIDEKLFTSGDASEVDARSELYASVGNGVLSEYASHRQPHSRPEYGDTGGGGGDRSDFRDWLVYKMIDTGPDGRGSLSFKLSDDLTSWRVLATAVDSNLGVGGGSVLVPVGLPFFVDATIAPEYLAADRPAIVVRAFGDALDQGDPVSITVDAPSLNFHAGPVAARAFESVRVPLPRLVTGRHEITIRATSGSGAGALKDGLTRTITVVDSRLSRRASRFAEIEGTGRVEGGPGLTTVVVSDAGAGRSVPILLGLAGDGGARLDSSLAAAAARSILTDRLGIAGDLVPPGDFARERFQGPDGGLGVLPYASSDLELSVVAALAAPERVDESRLSGYLAAIRDDPKATRERQTMALAGLAALGSPVLPELRAAAADPDLTIRERLFVGLGAARIGDSATARTVAGQLMDAYGESSAGRIRLRVGASAADDTTATALMAALAASIGDDRAPGLWAWVDANPAADTVVALQSVAYVDATLDWLDARSARFAWTVDGARTVVDLPPGGTKTLTVPPAQLAGLTIERLDGAIGVTSSWSEPVAASALKPDPDVSITRGVSPTGAIHAGDLVRVDMVVTFGPHASADCHEVTDHVPSGLMPVSNLAAWVDPNEAATLATVGLPYAQGDQLVHWCAAPTKEKRTAELRYYARVVTPGSYVWQPAIVGAAAATDRVSSTPETRIEIR
jgi:hypothetical protein